MEVRGKRSIGEPGMERGVSVTCHPCEEEGNYTLAAGLCQECEENMCKICFGHHRKAKVCKDHVLIDRAHMPTEKMAMDAKAEDGLEKCPHHLNELIKFYCPDHDRVGCGDCMILEHKMCRLDYIPTKAKEVKESHDLEKVFKYLNECDELKAECILEITAQEKHNEEMHISFITEAEAYRDELVGHVNKLTNEICDKAKDVHARNIESLGKREKNVADRSQEMSLINGTFESIRNQPNKLFVKGIEHKKRIEALKEELGEIKKNIKFEEYKFKANKHLDTAIKQCNPLDFMNSGLEDIIDEVEKSSVADLGMSQEYIDILNSMAAAATQYLFDQKLRAENIDIDGDYLSFAKDNIFGVHNGLFISNVAMTTGSYFEVEIINRGGADGSIGIGMVPDNYRRCAFPGWYRSSAGYHSDDGQIFIENSHGRPFGPPCGNSDKMGCGVAMVTSQSVDFFFTRNGNMIGQRTLRTGRSIYPAIALDTQGQKVKVILNATLPKF